MGRQRRQLVSVFKDQRVAMAGSLRRQAAKTRGRRPHEEGVRKKSHDRRSFGRPFFGTGPFFHTRAQAKVGSLFETGVRAVFHCQARVVAWRRLFWLYFRRNKIKTWRVVSKKEDRKARAVRCAFGSPLDSSRPPELPGATPSQTGTPRNKNKKRTDWGRGVVGGEGEGGGGAFSVYCFLPYFRGFGGPRLGAD